MKITGWQKNSFVDYPGKIASVVFTPGCNLHCYYCHNRQLLTPEALTNLIPEIEVFDYLQTRKGFLDAVVVSGGEPTIHPDLEEFIIYVKGLGYQVKLDTNGTNPDVLKNLIDKGLLDYVAMDIKSPFEKYQEICGTDLWTARINESIDLLMEGVTEYEFRTTVVPRLNEENLLAMANRIRGSSKYVLQQVRYHGMDTNTHNLWRQEQPHNAEFIRNTAKKLREIVKCCDVRGL